jgi:hypothetical protein
MTERKIVDYEMVYPYKIKERLNEGWRPYGHAFDTKYGPYQPMVRYAEPEPDYKLAQLALTLAKRVGDLYPPAKYKPFHELANAILAMQAGNDGKWEPEPDNAALVAYRDRIVDGIKAEAKRYAAVFTSSLVAEVADKIASGEIGGAV